MQQHPILIPSRIRPNFPAWVPAISLQAGALALTPPIHGATFAPDPLLVPTLASFTNAILHYIPPDAQTEAIHGHADPTPLPPSPRDSRHI